MPSSRLRGGDAREGGEGTTKKSPVVSCHTYDAQRTTGRKSFARGHLYFYRRTRPISYYYFYVSYNFLRWSTLQTAEIFTTAHAHALVLLLLSSTKSPPLPSPQPLPYTHVSNITHMHLLFFLHQVPEEETKPFSSRRSRRRRKPQ